MRGKKRDDKKARGRGRRKALWALTLGSSLTQDGAGAPGHRTGGLRALHQESAGPDARPGAGAFAGRDFSAEPTAGALMHRALSGGWCLPCDHRLPHHGGRGKARKDP